MNDVTTFTAADAGCLIDGHHGWHAHYMVVDLATDAGMTLSDDDRAALDVYRSGDPEQDPHGYAADAVLNQGGILDSAAEWLNDHAAPEGYLFQWIDGEFFLSPTPTGDGANIDYDGTVHATDDDRTPVCGTATVPAVGPTVTAQTVTCQECAGIVS